MSIQTSIERIESARNAIRAAITNKGVDASDATLDELAALISAIPLPVIDALRITANGTYTAPDGVDGYNPITVELPSAEQATPTISVSSSGLITASATQSGGLVAAGTKSATKQLTTKAAATITPTSSTQTAVSAGTYVTGDIKVQAEQAIGNLAALLQEAGSDTEHVIKTTVFIKDMNDFASVNEVYAKYFTKDFPARSCVEVARLPKDVLIEIEAIALKK